VPLYRPKEKKRKEKEKKNKIPIKSENKNGSCPKRPITLSIRKSPSEMRRGNSPLRRLERSNQENTVEVP